MTSPSRWNGPVSARFANVAYSSPEKVQGLTRSSDGDDRGELKVSPDEVLFSGRNMDLTIGKPLTVSMIRERIARLRLVVLGAVWLLVLAAAMFSGEPLTFLAWAAAMVPVTALLAWTALRREWVRVDYQDESGGAKSACFAVHDLEGVLGSTRDLYGAIAEHGPGTDRPITDDEANSLGSRGRRRRRLLWSACANWISIVVVATAGGIFLASYDPLAEGSEPGVRPTDPGSLFLTAGTSGRASGIERFCWAPNSRFAQFVTIKNTGMVPVTIYGEPPVPEFGWGDGFRQVDLAAYRDGGNKPTDPRTAPALTSASLGSGESIELWIRYQTGDRAPTDMGYQRVLGGVQIKFSVLWVTKTTGIDVRQIEMNGNCMAH